MNEPTSTAIEAILTEMASITSMERGTLSEEYRPAKKSGAVKRRGPYYKHQSWEKGRNVSRRVPASQVAALKADLANRERFAELADAFVEETVTKTRTLRRATDLTAEASEKKTP
ncbi:MAG: DUF6788 family protein [Verrucomicrobiales bacterium]